MGSGQYKPDTLQGHWHALVYKDTPGGSTFATTASNGVVVMGDRSGATQVGQKAGDAGTDGLHGAPRIGAETAPSHTRVLPVVLI